MLQPSSYALVSKGNPWIGRWQAALSSEISRRLGSEASSPQSVTASRDRSLSPATVQSSRSSPNVHPWHTPSHPGHRRSIIHQTPGLPSYLPQLPTSSALTLGNSPDTSDTDVTRQVPHHPQRASRSPAVYDRVTSPAPVTSPSRTSTQLVSSSSRLCRTHSLSMQVTESGNDRSSPWPSRHRAWHSTITAPRRADPHQDPSLPAMR